MKPVASGCRETPQGLRNEDAEALIAASDPAPAYALCNPYAFAPPIAPHIAARQAGVEIALDPIVAAYRKLAAWPIASSSKASAAGRCRCPMR